MAAVKRFWQIWLPTWQRDLALWVCLNTKAVALQFTSTLIEFDVPRSFVAVTDTDRIASTGFVPA